ncbi:ABC transporter permease [Streptosporangiaceae bacterium NEAU-GS5]|nr:ABC transporter permease [Streptosporangiaceae bacterium NEAU-GS5]
MNYLKIELLRMLRNKRYVIFVVAFPVGFYLLYASLWGGQTTDSGLRGSVLLMVSMAAYGALGASMMSTAVPWSTERKAGWLRQLQITPLPGRAIILTKLAASLLLVLPALLLVSLAAVLTQHVSLEAWQWAVLIPAMWIGTLPFAALGLTIGSFLPPDSAQPVAMIGMFGLSMLGGLWFPVDIMPSAMKSIAHATPSYDYANVGWQIAGGHTPPVSSIAGVVAWGVGLGALAVLSYRRATVPA